MLKPCCVMRSSRMRLGGVLHLKQSKHLGGQSSSVQFRWRCSGAFSGTLRRLRFLLLALAAVLLGVSRRGIFQFWQFDFERWWWYCNDRK